MKPSLTSWSITAIVVVCTLAACRIVPTTWPADATCTQLITPERVGEGVYEQLGLGEKLEQGRFERSESAGYVLCHYTNRKTTVRRHYPILDIGYLFDGATGRLVLTHIEGQDLHDQPATGPVVATRRCHDYVTPERIGQGVFDRYDIAEKLQDDAFVAMPNRGIVACLMGQEIGGVSVAEDELQFQFESSTSNLVFWRIHWREDLAEPIPPLKISQDDAYAMVPGGVIHPSHLHFISPDDSLPFTVSHDASPVGDDVYHHPCWFVWTQEGKSANTSCTTIIDAVTGKTVQRICSP